MSVTQQSACFSVGLDDETAYPTYRVQAFVGRCVTSVIKYVPGCKTDMGDSEWLAVLARFGLVRGSFIPPQDLRELRLISRYRRKASQMLSAEINRMHKTLDDAGIKLGAVVSDLNGVSARAMVAGLIAGKSLGEMLDMARGSLKNKREDLAASLDGDLSSRHPNQWGQTPLVLRPIGVTIAFQ